jgi:hypothetical protein
VLKEFTRGRVTDEELDKLVQTARANLLSAFEARAPKLEVKQEETKETVE